jgi:hypothetical protein
MGESRGDKVRIWTDVPLQYRGEGGNTYEQGESRRGEGR